MHYQIKILTPEFAAIVDKYIHEVTQHLSGFAKSMEMGAVRDCLYQYWNNPDSCSDLVKQYYTEKGVYPPKFTEQTVAAQERGLQNRARIIWEGQLQKIDEIDEIFSYKSI
jgi:hypothetical protein